MDRPDTLRARVVDRVAQHLLNRSNPRTLADGLMCLLRTRFPLVDVMDGPGGDTNLVGRLAGCTVFVQVKDRAHPMCEHEVQRTYEDIRQQVAPTARDQVWLVNTGGFTRPARAFARDRPLRLWKTLDLVQHLAPLPIPGSAPHDTPNRWPEVQGTSGRVDGF